MNVLARDTSLINLQRLSYLVEGSLCGNTGTSRENGKTVVKCRSVVSGNYLVLQVSQIRSMDIGELDITVYDTGIELNRLAKTSLKVQLMTMLLLCRFHPSYVTWLEWVPHPAVRQPKPVVMVLSCG